MFNEGLQNRILFGGLEVVKSNTSTPQPSTTNVTHVLEIQRIYPGSAFGLRREWHTLGLLLGAKSQLLFLKHPLLGKTRLSQLTEDIFRYFWL